MKIFSNKKKLELETKVKDQAVRIKKLEQKVKQLEENKPLAERIEDLKTNAELIKSIVQMVNKSPSLSVTLSLVGGDVLTIEDKKTSHTRDMIMLGV